MTTKAERDSTYLLRQMLQRKSTTEIKDLARIYAEDLAKQNDPAIYRAVLRDLTEVVDELSYRANTL